MECVGVIWNGACGMCDVVQCGMLSDDVECVPLPHGGNTFHISSHIVVVWNV